TISHELRTPLQSILGWSQLLEAGGLSEPDAARARQAIHRNARAQARIVEDILDTSRIISGRMRLQAEPAGPPPLLAAAIGSTRAAAESKRISLDLEAVPATPPVIRADRGRLVQVFWNLLSNAVKFTPEGGAIRIALVQEGARMQVRVADTGIGISPE